MRTRLFVLFGAVAVVMVLPLWAMLLVAQAPSGTKSFDATAVDPQASIKAAIAAAKAEAATKFTASKTAWGDPDLRGYYLVATYTPLQRPAALKDKEFYTEDELKDLIKREQNRVALNEEEGRPTEPGTDAGPLEGWVAEERARIAERHRARFLQAGAQSARIVSGPPDDTPFGARLRRCYGIHP